MDSIQGFDLREDKVWNAQLDLRKWLYCTLFLALVIGACELQFQEPSLTIDSSVRLTPHGHTSLPFVSSLLRGRYC